ncbi:MAG: multicopper oxidase domain-containing protein, partial [Acidobacteriota bacterium]
MITRRRLLWNAAFMQAATRARALPKSAILDPNRLAKFVDPLPVPPRAVSAGTRPLPGSKGEEIPFFRLTMRETATRFHRDLPPGRCWGFEGGSPGPTIEARTGQPILVEWVNALPRKHLFAIDHSLHGAEAAVPDVRTVVHVHGARVPPESDGYPENWYTPGKSLAAFYPNRQDAATLWYHDHAMSITRLNVYAGLFGFYLLRDEREAALHLPSGDYEIPLLLYDRSLTSGGQLHYPVSAIANRPWVPEFSGEAVLANGKLFPYLDVEPARYRLRLANVSNSRFLYLRLSAGQSFWQIGSDQGLLHSPVLLTRLTLAPGERADVIVDFAGQGGRNLLLATDSYEILQFRVREKASLGKSNSGTFLPAAVLRAVPRAEEREAVRTRLLTLDGPDDADDAMAMPMVMTLNGAGWHDPVTENPVLNSVEIWSLINLTDDSHPIHLHLVRFQILDRRPFDLFTYRNETRLRYTAAAIPPDANEAGWKDTVRAEPGMVTRIIVRFEGYAGRYVWHCHILEH